ncbi:hypothetical protein NDU88_006944 [Pleurodeles waltl]|uniref:Uncharacterized protein n=1 Tax=Pleurodeles waltl TaxID=8319 RepID=A0AAV7SR25_PLEWA|nr:hypothetical protein NDU88_006944 [Pleurodeles waltl]
MSRCSPWPRQNVAQAPEVMADMEQSVATGLLVSSSPGIPPTGRESRPACQGEKERETSCACLCKGSTSHHARLALGREGAP